jgi:hypothetical protein
LHCVEGRGFEVGLFSSALRESRDGNEAQDGDGSVHALVPGISILPPDAIIPDSLLRLGEDGLCGRRTRVILRSHFRNERGSRGHIRCVLQERLPDYLDAAFEFGLDCVLDSEAAELNQIFTAECAGDNGNGGVEVAGSLDR